MDYGKGKKNTTNVNCSTTYEKTKKRLSGTSLVVQWLRCCTHNAGDTGSNLGQGTKIPHATQTKTKTKTKRAISSQTGLL